MAYIPDQSASLGKALGDEYLRQLSGYAGLATSSIAEPIAGLNALFHANPDLVGKTRARLTVGNPANVIPNNLTMPEWARTGIGYFNESADRLGAISPVAGAALKTAPTFVAAMLPASSRAAFSSVGGDIGNALANPSFRSGANAQRGLIGGISSKTADHKLLAQAKELADSGASREDIWSNTGWFKDNDGHWKYEIDDSAATMNKKGLQDLMDYGWRKQKQLIDHPDMHSAYPHSADISTSTLTDGMEGARYADFNGQGEMIALSPKILREGLSRKKIAASALEETKKTNLHELQHSIQEKEGFARGGNPESISSDISALKELEGMSYSEMDDFQKEMFKSLRSKYGMAKSSTPYDIYKRLAGEAESRNVEYRANMTASERKARPPWMTLDVPENELIYR